MPELIVMRAGAEVRRYPVAATRLRLGRERDCEVRVGHRTVSRHHAELISVDRGAFVRDLDSCNGTFVNGRLVRLCRLRHGDVVRLGRHQLRYVETEALGSFVPMTDRRAPAPPVQAADPAPTLGRLRVLTGPLQGQLLGLKERLTAIGRASSPIAAIARGDRRCFVIRVGSWDRCEHLAVNGRTIGSRGRPLHDGDVLEVGNVRFAYLAPQAADEAQDSAGAR